MTKTSAFEIAPPVPREVAGFARKEVDRVAIKAFFGLVDQWALTREEALVLLGNPSQRTFYRWRDGEIAAVPQDTLERISVMLGIYKALNILLPIPERANAYLRRANTAFGGASALEVMLKGRVDSLYQVRRHLDAWRG